MNNRTLKYVKTKNCGSAALILADGVVSWRYRNGRGLQLDAKYKMFKSLKKFVKHLKKLGL